MAVLIFGDAMNTHPLPPINFRQHIDTLRSQGLRISHPLEAEEFFCSVSYHQFQEYYDDLLKPGGQKFFDGVTFEQISSLYTSDCQFRDALIPALRTIEIRSRIACSSVLTAQYGLLGYQDASHFENQRFHTLFLNEVEKIISHKTSYSHTNETLDLLEIIDQMSFGKISKLYKNMLPRDQKIVAKIFNFQYDALEKLLQNLVLLRNISAHHARLYRRRMSHQFPIPRQQKNAITKANPHFMLRENSVFSSILGLCLLLPEQEKSVLLRAIAEISTSNPHYKLAKLGFPPRWEEILSRNTQSSSDATQARARR